jgi:hypothetical protein
VWAAGDCVAVGVDVAVGGAVAVGVAVAIAVGVNVEVGVAVAAGMNVAVGVGLPQAPPVTLISTEVVVLVPVYPPTAIAMFPTGPSITDHSSIIRALALEWDAAWAWARIAAWASALV